MYLNISAEKVLILLTEWKFWLPLKTWSSIISRTTSSNSRVQKFRFLHAFHKFAYCLFHVRSVRPALKKFSSSGQGWGSPSSMLAWSADGGGMAASLCEPRNPVSTPISTYQYKQVHSSTYWFVQDHTSTYQYIPVYTSTYQYILVCTSMYQYIQVYTGMYRYVLVHPCLWKPYYEVTNALVQGSTDIASNVML